MKKHLFILLILFILMPNIVYGASENKVLNLTVYPQKVLFDIRNVKPGDSFERKFKVLNNGENDFRYIISSKFKEGSKDFFDQLTLRIKDSSKVVFEGKLHEFEKLDSRLLKSNSQEDLNFFVTVPYELDNHYQGLDSKFELKLYVEGTLGGTIPADGPKLPATGTNMFNTLVAGALLVITGSILQFYFRRLRKIEDNV